nr:vegetative cell wall protein gp1-like [Aegilops tauschii subsp. strangulata]
MCASRLSLAAFGHASATPSHGPSPARALRLRPRAVPRPALPRPPCARHLPPLRSPCDHLRPQRRPSRALPRSTRPTPDARRPMPAALCRCSSSPAAATAHVVAADASLAQRPAPPASPRNALSGGLAPVAWFRPLPAKPSRYSPSPHACASHLSVAASGHTPATPSHDPSPARALRLRPAPSRGPLCPYHHALAATHRSAPPCAHLRPPRRPSRALPSSARPMPAALCRCSSSPAAATAHVVAAGVPPSPARLAPQSPVGQAGARRPVPPAVC